MAGENKKFPMEGEAIPPQLPQVDGLEDKSLGDDVNVDVISGVTADSVTSSAAAVDELENAAYDVIRPHSDDDVANEGQFDDVTNDDGSEGVDETVKDGADAEQLDAGEDDDGDLMETNGFEDGFLGGDDDVTANDEEDANETPFNRYEYNDCKSSS